VRALLDAGVRTFVDLTEDGELVPYADSLTAGVQHVRKPIADLSCATPEQMAETLDVIDAALERGVVYVHCRGGCGRTGTVLACHLVRHGVPPEEALERFHRFSRVLWSHPCPETEEQRAMVLAWRAGR
jgi:protein-tyrosine phosphatase